MSSLKWLKRSRQNFTHMTAYPWGTKESHIWRHRLHGLAAILDLTENLFKKIHHSKEVLARVCNLSLLFFLFELFCVYFNNKTFFMQTPPPSHTTLQWPFPFTYQHPEHVADPFSHLHQNTYPPLVFSQKWKKKSSPYFVFFSKRKKSNVVHCLQIHLICWILFRNIKHGL